MYLAALIVAFLTNSRGGMQIETSHSPEAVTLAPGAPPGQIVRRPCHRFAAQNGTDSCVCLPTLESLRSQKLNWTSWNLRFPLNSSLKNALILLSCRYARASATSPAVGRNCHDRNHDPQECIAFRERYFKACELRISISLLNASRAVIVLCME